jgi:hypothetical protein
LSLDDAGRLRGYILPCDKGGRTVAEGCLSLTMRIVEDGEDSYLVIMRTRKTFSFADETISIRVDGMEGITSHNTNLAIWKTRMAF